MLKTFRDFLTEEELIGYAEYPLAEKYRNFNRLYFGGTLPDIPVIWGNPGKRTSGATTAKYIHRGNVPRGFLATLTKMEGEVRDLKITLSKEVPKRTETNWDGILLHEMIHVRVITDGYWFEQHGTRFLALVQQISKLWGHPVPVTDKISPEEMEHIDGKPYVLMIFMDSNDTAENFTYSTLMPNWRTKSDELRATMSRIWDRYTMEITAIFVPDSKFATRVKLGRTLPADRYRVSAKTLDMINTDRKMGQVLWTFNPKAEKIS